MGGISLPPEMSVQRNVESPVARRNSPRRGRSPWRSFKAYRYLMKKDQKNDPRSEFKRPLVTTIFINICALLALFLGLFALPPKRGGQRNLGPIVARERI